MQYDTANGACTHPKWIRFGARRRQCVTCKKTWTVRAKKRGAKPTKHRMADLEKTFVEKLTLVQQSRRTSIGANGLSKRHAKSLASLCEKPWPHTVPLGFLILVMDAVWFSIDRKQYTLYLTGFRAVDDDTLHFLPPILRLGHESQKEWREIIRGIDEEIRDRVRAVVSDSFSGSGNIAKQNKWVYQRCQAHLLIRLSTLCGDNKFTVSWREGRQEIKRLMHALMNVRDPEKVSGIVEQLFILSRDPRCPERLYQIVKRTVRTLHEFRACYLHPELRLPATTNAVENTNGRIRGILNRARGCRTPTSLIQWITGFLWFHPTVTCRPKLPTEIKR
jgi:Transposase, Mutator family